MRPSWLEIDLQAVAQNLALVKKALPSSTRMLPVVKADAYGLGMLRVARSLLKEGVWGFAVAFLEEGIALQNHLPAGEKLPIFLMAPGSPGEVEETVKRDFIVTLSNLPMARLFSDEGEKQGKKIRAHVKIDCGMNRIGFPAVISGEEFPYLLSLPGLEIDGIYTHFPSPEDEDLTRRQFQQFLAVAKALEKGRGRSLLKHVANSAVLFLYPEMSLDMVRPGLILYGVVPKAWTACLSPARSSLSLPQARQMDVAREGGEDLASCDSTGDWGETSGRLSEGAVSSSGKLLPAVSLKAQVVQSKEVESNVPVSYGGIFVTQEDGWIGTLPLGYADGIPRRIAGGGTVLFQGKHCPVAGAVCMDHLMFFSPAPVALWEEVVLLGGQGRQVITVGEWAELSGTVPHEILSSFSWRLHRLYRESS